MKPTKPRLKVTFSEFIQQSTTSLWGPVLYQSLTFSFFLPYVSETPKAHNHPNCRTCWTKHAFFLVLVFLSLFWYNSYNNRKSGCSNSSCQSNSCKEPGSTESIAVHDSAATSRTSSGKLQSTLNFHVLIIILFMHRIN